MKSDYSAYDLTASVDRIDEILDSNDADYTEQDSIPSRDTLTFTNGFYVYCSALFIDMRGSKKLPEKHKNPTLAKIYRTYISELVAILRDNTCIREISIEGDCVWAIYDTPKKVHIDLVFASAYYAASLVDILNYKYSKRNITEISVGIGASYGRALMIKAGYKGSGVNEVTWMGTLVGEAAKLCSHGNRDYSNKEIFVSNVFHDNLNDENKKLLVKHYSLDCYHGNVISIAMNNWLDEQKQRDQATKTYR